MIGIEDQLISALRQIVRSVDLHSKRLIDDFGLTGPQLATLQAASRLGAAAPSAIAREVHLSQATVTGILHRLEQRELIIRQRSVVDRRGVVVDVTKKGQALLEEAPSLLHDRFRRQLEQLEPWERHLILSVMQRVAGMMDDATAEPMPADGSALAVTPRTDGEQQEVEPAI